MRAVKDQTVLSDIAIPNDLWDQVDACASRDQRTPEKTILLALEQYVSKRKLAGK